MRGTWHTLLVGIVCSTNLNLILKIAPEKLLRLKIDVMWHFPERRLKPPFVFSIYVSREDLFSRFLIVE